jgi:hypothetical protein
MIEDSKYKYKHLLYREWVIELRRD